MTLEEGKIGNEYSVLEIKIEGSTKRRLESLGMTEGTKVSVLNNKKNGTLIFKVRGTRLAIGKEIAESIVIKEVM
jgi:ferrous iron transport protein A